MDVGAVGIAPAGSVTSDVATAEGCGIGLVDVTVVVVGEGVYFGAHAVGVGIDVAEFVLDAVPFFAEFGGPPAESIGQQCTPKEGVHKGLYGNS